MSWPGSGQVGGRTWVAWPWLSVAGKPLVGVINHVARLLFACPGKAPLGVILLMAGTFVGFGTIFLDNRPAVAEP